MPVVKDHTGTRFGNLLAVERIPTKGKQTNYRCICDCGTEVVASGRDLVTKNTKSCGCLAHKTGQEQQQAKVGSRHGRMVVKGYSHAIGYRHYFICECDCGSQFTSSWDSIRVGHTLSCGCLHKELTSRRSTTHGLTNHPLYSTWKGMKTRCLNANSQDYQHYGGRGITICQQWAESFECFLADMGPRPDGFTVERLDNNGPYDPDNCIWASRSTQMFNTRHSRKNKMQPSEMKNAPTSLDNAAAIDNATNNLQ